MADVFLSYSSKDRAAAEHVQQALSARGIDVFWDQETPPGQDWDTWIRSKLSTCKVAVVLWSRTSVKSDNVRHEALVARKANKLLPTMIDSISAEDLPMGLYMVQTINLTDWRSAESKGMAQLAAEIAARVGKRPAAAAAPRTPPAPASTAAGSSKAGLFGGLAFFAIAAAGAAWYFLQSPEHPTPTASTSVPAQPGATQTPGAECLDHSTPNAEGLCANNLRPIPPAPVLGVGSAPATSTAMSQPSFGGAMSRAMLGRWHWSGLDCAKGPVITLEGDTLVFTTPDTRYVHRIDRDTDVGVTTTVVDCLGCKTNERGEQYTFKTPALTPLRDATTELVVLEGATMETNTWQRCRPAS